MARRRKAKFATSGTHVADFFLEYCRHTKGRWGGQAVELEPWQRDFIDEAFRLNADGERVYHTAVLGIPRKNGKSTLGAGLGLYFLTADGEISPEVMIAAGSKDQAGIVFGQAKDMVDANADLTDFLDARLSSILRRDADTGFAKRISADGKMQHGLNPHAVIMDELHAVQAPRQAEMWSALSTGSGAREEPFTLVITTEGTDESETLHALVDDLLSRTDHLERRGECLRIVRDEERGTLLWWYGVDETSEAGRNLDLSKESSWLPLFLAANPASWIDTKSGRKSRLDPKVSEGDFKRLHLNMRTFKKDAWFSSGVWPALARSVEVTRIPEGADVWLGVDVGMTGDSTAVAIARVMPDDHETEADKILLKAHVWATRQDVIAHDYVAGGRFRNEIARVHIEELARRYRVLGLAYDPRFFDESAQTLSDAGMNVVEVDQSSAVMAAAYQAFYMGVVESTVLHELDPIVGAHVAAVGATMTERGWKVYKLRQTQKFDAVAAMAMAHHLAKTQTPSVYEKRGLIVVGEDGHAGDAGSEEPEREHVSAAGNVIHPGR